MMGDRKTITGEIPMTLANEVSDAIHRALERGMAIDEAACVVASIAADYAREEYGDAYLPQLANVVVAQAGRQMPADISKQ